jgi:lysosomal acid lipase/cholesteryl ester hydrolase
MSPTSNEFWDFSFHEIGYFDVPAMIDFVLNHTKSSKLFYIGHSQGTSSILVLLSKRPEYNQKVMQVHLFAPAAFMKNSMRPELMLVRNEIEVEDLIFHHFSFAGKYFSIISNFLKTTKELSVLQIQRLRA